MDLNEIRTFVKVVQAGSFSGAATQLGMPNSTVSAKVSALEKRLGVTLLQRTTRKLHVTEAGEAYFRRCVQGLDEIARAEAEVSSSQREPQGRLRVTAPNDLGGGWFVDLVSGLARKHPKLSLEFVFTDRMVDLVAEGIDVGIRAGELRDSGLIARKAGSVCWSPYASPAYLKRAGRATHPKDLRAHACLQFAPMGEDAWELTNGRQTVKVPMSRRILSSEMSLIKGLALAGDGIALMPTYTCVTEVQRGSLVRVLPDWNASLEPVHVVYPEQKFLAPKLRVFIDAAVEAFARVI
jgi:DNA-binding transcriptional LysR family regulator